MSAIVGLFDDCAVLAHSDAVSTNDYIWDFGGEVFNDIVELALCSGDDVVKRRGEGSLV